MILGEALSCHLVRERHSDANRHRRCTALAALPTLDHPGPVAALDNSGIVRRACCLIASLAEGTVSGRHRRHKGQNGKGGALFVVHLLCEVGRLSNFSGNPIWGRSEVVSIADHAVARDASHVGMWRALALVLAIVSWAVIAWAIWMLI